MTPAEAIPQLRAACDSISRQVTGMHPIIRNLGAPEAQSEIIKACFELTKQVEVIKKHLIKLEKQDGSTLV